MVFFSFLLSVISLEGFGLVPLLCIYFSPFFNKIFRVWRHRMEISRGANLVGMSMLPLDVCPFSLLIKKNYNLSVININLFSPQIIIIL